MNFTIFDPGSGYASKHFKILQAADNKALAGFYFIQTPPICSTCQGQVDYIPCKFDVRNNLLYVYFHDHI